MNTELREWIIWTNDKGEFRKWLVNEIVSKSNGALEKPDPVNVMCGAPAECQPTYTEEEVNREIDEMLADGTLCKDSRKEERMPDGDYRVFS